jgi:hypothetical protein
VEAGVNDQTRGAEAQGLEQAGLAEPIILAEAELVDELLGIERPALGIGVEAGKAGAASASAEAGIIPNGFLTALHHQYLRPWEY